MPRILGIGYYSEDIRYVMSVIKQLPGTWDPTVLVTGLEPQRTAAFDMVRAAGMRPLDTAGRADCTARNPFRRRREIARANTTLAEEILRRSQPDVILTTINLAHGYFFPTARRMGIPSAYMQWTEIHSLKAHERFWKADSRRADVLRTPLDLWKRRLLRPVERLAGFGPRWPMAVGASRVAVQAPFYARMAIDAGVQEASIVVTGNPQCDEMYQAASLTASELSSIRRRLNLDPDVPYLLHLREQFERMHTVDPAESDESTRSIMTGMQSGGQGLPIVIKPHPKESTESIQRLRQLAPSAIIADRAIPTGHLIAASALVVSTLSSTLLWAVGIDRPAISSFFWRSVPELRMRRHWSGVEKADTVADLSSSVSRNLSDAEHATFWRARRAECRKEFLVLDGRGAQRVAELLAGLVSVN